jgi:hypothetical protein
VSSVYFPHEFFYISKLFLLDSYIALKDPKLVIRFYIKYSFRIICKYSVIIYVGPTDLHYILIHYKTLPFCPSVDFFHPPCFRESCLMFSWEDKYILYNMLENSTSTSLFISFLERSLMKLKCLGKNATFRKIWHVV